MPSWIGPVELADGLELLEVGDDLVPLVVRQRHGLLDGLETLRVVDGHALGSLEVREVAQRLLAERHELDPHACRVAVGRHGEVGAGEARRGTHGGQQVLDDREMKHLLLADLQQGLPPALHRGERLRREPLVTALSLSEKAANRQLEHDQAHELGRLAEGTISASRRL